MPTGSRYTESATQMALENVLTFRSRLKELTNKHWIQIYAQLREFTLEGKVRTEYRAIAMRNIGEKVEQKFLGQGFL